MTDSMARGQAERSPIESTGKAMGDSAGTGRPTCRHSRAWCQWLIGAVVVLLGSRAPAGVVTDETIKAFIEHLEQNETYTSDGRAFVIRMWADRQEDDDADSFIAESLAVLSPPFRSGLDAYEDEDYAKAQKIMEGLSSDDDSYLSANASVFAIKSLVEVSRLEEARKLLEEFLSDPTAVDLYTSYAAEMAYVRGYLALQTIHYDEAAVLLQEMLARYPEAGQRLRVSARQILAELRRREPERIADVADLMVYAGRRLGHEDTAELVQEQQQRAIDLLEQLIEEAEQQEQGGGGGGGGSSGSNGGKRSPQSPMQDSMLPGGSGAGVHLRSERRARPGEEWGSMPPAEREKILQSLRMSFPSRYRQLVEQYYEELAKQP